jgi:hypothetical protein
MREEKRHSKGSQHKGSNFRPRVVFSGMSQGKALPEMERQGREKQCKFVQAIPQRLSCSDPYERRLLKVGSIREPAVSRRITQTQAHFNGIGFEQDYSGDVVIFATVAQQSYVRNIH